MKYLILALFFPLAAIVQSTALFQALPGGVTLDVSLLLVVYCGFRYGAAAGSASGLWAGTIIGAFRLWQPWSLALIYGFIGWLAGLHSEKKPAKWTYPLAGVALCYLSIVLEIELAGFGGEAAPCMGWVMATTAWHGAFCLAVMPFAAYVRGQRASR